MMSSALVEDIQELHEFVEIADFEDPRNKLTSQMCVVFGMRLNQNSPSYTTHTSKRFKKTNLQLSRKGMVAMS